MIENRKAGIVLDIRQIYPSIYQVQLPLRGNPLKELNCYIVKGSKRNLVIDTAFNQEEAKNILLEALGQLDCPLEKTDSFLTHCHADHAGLLYAIKTKDNRCYTSEVDGEIVNAAHRPGYRNEGMAVSGPRMGFLQSASELAAAHPASSNRCPQAIDFTYVKEGDRIDLGGFVFEVVDLSGHSPGQVGLYEPDKQLLFVGDHILGKITPNITYWNDDFDALGVYLANLRKVRAMDVQHMYGAHRFNVESHVERVDQLLAHHDRRLEEVRGLLRAGKQTAFEVAAGMHWDFGGGDFLNFPLTQQWFAAGEALSHLEYLRHNGQAVRAKKGPLLLYRLA